MSAYKEKIIGELVADDYRTAAVFKAFGIDFCCKGNRTVNDACVQKNISSEDVEAALEKAVNQNSGGDGLDFKSWPMDLLADYIEKTHHRYVETAIEQLRPYLAKICKVHGAEHPELFTVAQHFNDSAAELKAHMEKEEQILFPYVRKLQNFIDNDGSLEQPHFGTVRNPIQMMMAEHEAEGNRFEEIAKLSNNYTPPQDACNTYRVTFALLQEFENDLHRHIHLENNILFPDAIEKEEKLQAFTQ